MAKKSKQRGLGRGLSALMADVQPETSETPQAPTSLDREVPVERISPNPDQPRQDFSKSDLEDLAASIKEKGIIQPLIVRENSDKPNTYEIVAGERRWRAAQMAQVHTVPVIVREFTDLEVLEVAIIENIQRADLNPVEEAMGYRQLLDGFGHTQEQLSRALGKSRSHIANLMRLLQLPEDVQVLLRNGDLSSGHARALITSENASELAKLVVSKGLSVRETERLVKAPAKTPKAKTRPTIEKDADTRALENDLSANLGMKVVVDHTPGQEAGTMTIKYKSLEELDELCRVLTM